MPSITSALRATAKNRRALCRALELMENKMGTIKRGDSSIDVVFRDKGHYTNKLFARNVIFNNGRLEIDFSHYSRRRRKSGKIRKKIREENQGQANNALTQQNHRII
ncbi:MAG: hypothetical protein WC799_21125 [Desulfobacteraceae bacterium]|jgi:hypothetical protein